MPASKKPKSTSEGRPASSRGQQDQLSSSPEEYFQKAYQQVMYTGLAGLYSALVHFLIERPFRGTNTPKVIELGAGHGQHAKHVRTKVNEYIELDIDASLAPNGPRAANGAPVKRIVGNAEDLSALKTNSFDRLIATCLLAHLDNPEAALEEWRRVVKPGGSISIYVPAEPGMMLRLFRRIFMVRKAARYGQDHMATIYRDHRNHFPGMQSAINKVFANDCISRQRFPFRQAGWNLSLFEIVHIRRCGK